MDLYSDLLTLTEGVGVNVVGHMPGAMAEWFGAEQSRGRQGGRFQGLTRLAQAMRDSVGRRSSNS